MRFDKLTLRAQEAFQSAQAWAERMKHTTLESEHMLAALLAQEDGVTKPILEKLSVDSGKLLRVARQAP